MSACRTEGGPPRGLRNWLRGGTAATPVMSPRGYSSGFSVIELLIVVGVLSLAIFVAFPSYREHIARVRRADAQTVLLDAAQFMERFYTENGRYHQTRAGVAVALPAGLLEAPKDAGAKYYDISLQAVAQNTYTLRSVPKNAQLGDRCGTLTLTNAGVKGAAQTDCWRR